MMCTIDGAHPALSALQTTPQPCRGSTAVQSRLGQQPSPSTESSQVISSAGTHRACSEHTTSMLRASRKTKSIQGAVYVGTEYTRRGGHHTERETRSVPREVAESWHGVHSERNPSGHNLASDECHQSPGLDCVFNHEMPQM